MFWGSSPALDLQEEYLKHCDNKEFELNFLVIGGCDARHVLKTLAQAYRHSRRYINLFVVDGCTELIARQIFLLSLALERTDRGAGLAEKTRRFLEVYGNMLLRPSTSRYMIAKSRQLIGMITNPEYMRNLLPAISVDQMKYRDRDYMENLLNFWMTGNTNQFDACGLWEHRLRRSLGVRYDTRSGVFDWDYHMRMKEIARAVCSTEYKHFREHGVAFTWLETEVCRPNNTLVASVYACGERYLHRGYLGDIVTGPFVTYGLDCEDENMLKNSNGVNFKRSTDLAERNVMRIMYELEQRKKFEADTVTDTHNLGLAVLSEFDARQSASVREQPLLLRESRDTYVDVDFGKVHFLSLSALEHYPSKPEFQSLFHGIFVGHNTLNRVRPTVFEMVREGGLVIFETRKYIVELKREDVTAFADQIRGLAVAAHCSNIEDFDPQRSDFAKYVIRREGTGLKIDEEIKQFEVPLKHAFAERQSEQNIEDNLHTSEQVKTPDPEEYGEDMIKRNEKISMNEVTEKEDIETKI